MPHGERAHFIRRSSRVDRDALHLPLRLRSLGFRQERVDSGRLLALDRLRIVAVNDGNPARFHFLGHLAHELDD
jgi:hypothetical protein